MANWILPIIKLLLKFGLPWLESHVAPSIATIIKDILKMLGESSDQTHTMTQIKEGWDKVCTGINCPVK